MGRLVFAISGARCPSLILNLDFAFFTRLLLLANLITKFPAKQSTRPAILAPAPLVFVFPET